MGKIYELNISKFPTDVILRINYAVYLMNIMKSK